MVQVHQIAIVGLNSRTKETDELIKSETDWWIGIATQLYPVSPQFNPSLGFTSLLSCRVHSTQTLSKRLYIPSKTRISNIIQFFDLASFWVYDGYLEGGARRMFFHRLCKIR